MQGNPARFLANLLAPFSESLKVSFCWAAEYLLGWLSVRARVGGAFRFVLVSAFFFVFGVGVCTSLQARAEGLNSSSAERSKPAELAPFSVTGDGVQVPLGAKQGLESRGAQIVISREGQCTLCHAIPGYKGQVGNLAPLLEGVGARLTKAQLRLRIINSSLIFPQTIMPSYYKVDGLVNVDPQWIGVPLMNEQQIEDVVAYLSSLK